MKTAPRRIQIPVIPATPESTAPFGRLIDRTVTAALDIPMILAPPNHDSGRELPDLDQMAALRFTDAGLLLHLGTWHDFPLACDQEVSFLIGNSEEVIDALAACASPVEMDTGDVFKIRLADRFGIELVPATE